MLPATMVTIEADAARMMSDSYTQFAKRTSSGSSALTLKRRVRLKLEEFFGADLRSLAIFRIGLAALLICDLVLRARDLVAHYTDAGVLPRAALLELSTNPWYASIHLMDGTAFVQAALFCVAGLCALALLVGYRTRLFACLSWVFLTSLQLRNPLVLHGGDLLLRMMLFWGLFVPLGARYSVDRLLNASSDRLPTRVLSMGTVALVAQVALLYSFNAAQKSGAEWHAEASAVYYALSLDQFVTPTGELLLGVRGLLPLLTHAVWWAEAVGWLLLFVPVLTGPLRTVTVMGFWVMHASFGLCLWLGLFPWICSVALLPLIPAWCWDTNLRRGPTATLKTALARHRIVEPVASLVRTRLAPRPLVVRPSRIANVLAAGFLAYVFCWNLSTLEGGRSASFMPASARWMGSLLSLEQKWSMFAPYPTKDDGWFVIPGRLKDGTELDVFRWEGPVRWEKPAQVSRTYSNERWRKYLTNLWKKRHSGHRLYYGRYLCRQWNARHQGDEQLDTFEIVFVRETTLPNYQVAVPKNEVLWNHYCFAKDKG